MGIRGKIKNMGKTVIKTTYEQSGAQDLKKGAQSKFKKADRSLFGGKGLSSNIKRVKAELKKAAK